MAKYLDSTGLTYLWGKITAAFQAKVTASGLLKGDGSGGVTAATSGTDYQAPLPSQSGNSGKYLTTNGSALSWGSVTVPTGSSTSPAMDGTAAAGTETTWAHGDHVHPTDTSRQAKITASGILKGDGAGGVTAATAGTDYVASHNVLLGTVNTDADPITCSLTYSTMRSAVESGKTVILLDTDGTLSRGCYVYTFSDIDPSNSNSLNFVKCASGGKLGDLTCTSSDVWTYSVNTVGMATISSGTISTGKRIVTAATLISALGRSKIVNEADTNYSTVMARGIYAGTSSMTPGTTSLTNGVIYLQYDA